MNKKLTTELPTRKDKKYYLWEFELKDGSFIRAKFTDDEIKEMQIKYPQIRWS